MLDNILSTAMQKIAEVTDLESLQHIKAEFLGKNSQINAEMKKLGIMDGEERKIFGQKINQIKEQIQYSLNAKSTKLEEQQWDQVFLSEKLDLSMPSRPFSKGSIHPITQSLAELVQIFASFGFQVKEGPSIESDWYNFTALSIDENHPARQMHDTFYLKNGQLLRTHTSPMQIRTIESGPPPFKFICPGRTYRCDSDTTHTPMFHQIEGMVIDKNINMGHLKYVIAETIKQFFEQPNIEVRFRPSFFPFTEPSAEVDLRFKGNDSWLEVLGCGMVHPKVLQNCKIDSEEYRGFAFGLGLERFAMLKYGIKDLRQFYEGDQRWINHYNFASLDIPNIVNGLTR